MKIVSKVCKIEYLSGQIAYLSGHRHLSQRFTVPPWSSSAGARDARATPRLAIAAEFIPIDRAGNGAGAAPCLVVRRLVLVRSFGRGL